MLDYTKVALNQIETDVKKVSLVSNVISQLVYIAYLVYTLLVKAGVFTVNVILLVLSVGYFAFFLYATSQEMKDKIKRTVRLVYKRCKQFIRLYTLGVMIYGLCLTAGNASTASVVFTVLMALGFLVDIALEFFVKYFISRSHMLLEAMKADFETATKPVRTVGNFFKKITGHETVEEEPTKERKILDKKVSEIRDERKNKKLETKFLNAKRKREQQERKRAERAAKKANKKPKRAEKTAEKPVETTEPAE